MTDKQCNNNKCSNLSMCHLGLSLGIVHGLVLLALAYVSMFNSSFMHFVKSLELVLSGFGPHFVGGLMGFIWGFVSGYVVGTLIAFFYNLCNKYCCCTKGACKTNDHKK